jgi:signal transduction histidine kinase
MILGLLSRGYCMLNCSRLLWIPVAAAFILFSLPSKAQNDQEKIDSLNAAVQNSKGADQFDATLELMRVLLKYDATKALELSFAAEKIASSMNDSLRIEKAIYARGFIQSKLNMTREAVASLTKSLGIANRNKFETESVKILNTLAIVYSLNGNYDKSLEYHFQALQINEKLGDKESASLNFNNIGFVFFKLKDWENAITNFTKSLELKREINSTFDLDKLLVNLALAYNQNKQYAEAEKKIKETFTFCGEKCDDKVVMPAEFSLGVSLSEQGHRDEAVEHFLKSLELSKQLNDTRFEIENLWNLGSNEVKRGNRSKGIEYLKESEKLAIKTNYFIPLIEVYKEFSTLYTADKDFKNSSLYQSKYIKLKDSIYSEDLIKNLAKVQANFAERENIKTISEQNDIIALKDQVLGKQRTITVLAMVIALLLLGFTYFAIQSGRTYSAKLKRHNEELEQKVLERTKELQKSNEKLLKAQHDLNNFLYKTSHDIRGPVATLKGLYNLITTKQNEPEELKDLIVREGVQIEKINKILNRISMVTSIQNTFLKTEVIDFHMLLNDILDFEKKNGQLKHIRVLVDVEPGLKMISDPYMIHLILENMVDNSLKFFNESTRIDPFVKITVSTSGSDALIKVEDNGVGIIIKPGQDVFTMFLRGSERSDIGGVGLYLCKVIADKLEGTIKLEKTSKEGTTFSLKLTLDATEQIKAWNTYLESEYRQEQERQIEYEKREQAAEQAGKGSNPFITT